MGYSSASLRQVNVVMAPDFMSSILYAEINSVPVFVSEVVVIAPWKYHLPHEDPFTADGRNDPGRRQLMSVKITVHFIFKVKLTVVGGHVFVVKQQNTLNYMRVKFFCRLSFCSRCSVDLLLLPLPLPLSHILLVRGKRDEIRLILNSYRLIDSICEGAYCCIMNNSDPSMGDSGDNMGLQKIDMRSFDNKYVKDKSSYPQDFVDGFPSDIPNGGFTQIQEDLMTVLKNISKGIGKDSSAGNLFASENPVLDSVDVTDSEEIFSSMADDVMPGSFSNFDRDFLNVADIDMSEEISSETVVSNGIDAVESPVCYKEKYHERKDRILNLERRIDRLSRRLRIKQSKLLNAHVRDQVYCWLTTADRRKRNNSESSKLSEQPRPVHLNNQSFVGEDVCDRQDEACPRSDSPSNAAQQQQQQRSFVPFTNSQSQHCNLQSGNTNTAVERSYAECSLDPDNAEVVGSLKLQAKTLSSVFDPDATASSSGNDSLDEEPSTESRPEEERTLKIPLKKRAVWKWLHERAGGAYRIVWLQSQILDLEYKIHQYTDLYRKLRMSKSKVVLQDRHRTLVSSQNVHNSATSPAGAAASGGGGAASAVATGTSSSNRLGGAHLVVNGYHGSLYPNPEPFYNNSNGGKCDGSGVESECSRTRPFARNKFSRRKLLNIRQQLSAIKLKNTVNAAGYGGAAAAVAVRCNCIWPLSCILCIRKELERKQQHGSQSNSQVHPPVVISTQAFKNSLVDPAYHPVLSNSSNVSISAYLSTLLRKPDVHDRATDHHHNAFNSQQSLNKLMYVNSKKMISIDDASKTKSPDISTTPNSDHLKRRKYTKRAGNNGDLQLGGSQLNKRRHSKLLADKSISYKKHKRKKKRLFKLSESDLDDNFPEMDDFRREDIYSSQPNSPFNTHSSGANKESQRRKREHSFDIDNFIIPPNTTQQPVIVKPKYKDILIPRWKVVTDEENQVNNINRSTVPYYVLEDINLDIVSLHDKLETHEKQKFSTLVNPDKNHGRGRKRADSGVDANEMNGTGRTTPLSDQMESVSSQSTPLSGSMPFNYNNGAENNIPSSSSKKIRTISLTRGKIIYPDGENASMDSSQPEMAPFEPRQFPLTDEEVEVMLNKDNSYNIENCIRNIVGQRSIFRDETPSSSRLQSPASESTESILEDVNDRDWMQEFLEKERLLDSSKQ